jgi:DNA repair protein RadC
MKAQTETPRPYVVDRVDHTEDDAILARAEAILRGRLRGRLVTLSSPTEVKDYLHIAISAREHEVFMCIWLDAQNRVITTEEMFRGTLTQTSVYPREIVKEALRHNAANVVFAHNHPSGIAEPSHADEMITRHLKQALALVDVKVLDRFVVAADSITSFAERGLL